MNKNYKEMTKKLLIVFLCSVMYALCIKLIVQPKGFLAGGVSGITILISRFVSIKLNKDQLESILYSILYVAFNIPIFVFGFKKIGKQFIVFSMINVLLSSLLVSLIPASLYHKLQLDSVDQLTNAIIAGIVQGIGSSLAFSSGFSQGGTDIISVYLSRSKGKGIGSYSFAMNVLILLIGGIAFKNYSALIYTIIYFFIYSLTVNNLYIGYKKTLVEVISEKPEEMMKKLMKVSHHGCTIVSAIGAYSGAEKKILRVVIASNQIKYICGIIKTIDPDSFTTLSDIKLVSGRFYIPPIK